MKYAIKETPGGQVLVDESAEIKEGDNYANGRCIYTADRYYEKVSDDIKIITTINHSISLDVPMVVTKDEIPEITKDNYYLVAGSLSQPLKQDYIELEMEEYAVGNYGMSDGEPTIDSRIKTNRVNGQLMAYVKQ